MPPGQRNVTVAELRAKCPKLYIAVDALAEQWLKPALDRLDAVDKGIDTTLRAKQLNDPIWHTFELQDREILLLDSPLIQRMRGIKQLGLAHLVFPAANHDRFEHTCGVVAVADRMFTALKRNAEQRREKDKRAGREPPTLNDHERITVRLAALLHDIGHGPFSHAIEPFIDSLYKDELDAFNKYIKDAVYLDQEIEIAELISILIVLSPSMEKILGHSLFKRPDDCSASELQLRIATLIMGARRHGQLACLSAVISGQVDADKLDYMPRDAHHSGMPIAFDTERLLHKLEIVCCTPDNLPPAQNQKGNIKFAENSPNGRYFDLGIAAAGVGSLEQMLIGRAFLYDRLYHHHKVRAADAMAQRLLHFVAESRKSRDRPFKLSELYLPVSDDTMIRLLGGIVKMDGVESSVPEAAFFLARSILDRNLYVRAFAFRASFHTGLPETDDEKKKNDAMAAMWSPVSTELSSLSARLAAEEKIIQIAKRVAPKCDDQDIAALGEKIKREHVIVDLAGNRIKPVMINVHAEDGSLEVPTLFFDPGRWSDVYNLQKRTGYVFCPREFVPLVALAAKIHFFEEWGYAASEKADRFTKTLPVIKPKWIETLKENGTIDSIIVDVLSRRVTTRAHIRRGDIKFPDAWQNEAPDLENEIVDKLRDIIPQGISSEDKQAVVDTLVGLASFISAMHQDRNWITADAKEKDLQQAMARYLRARDLRISEAGALGGGEFDLIVNDRTLIENKIAGRVAAPFESKPDAPYQANRYAIAACQRVFFTVIGYTPKDEAGLIEQTKSIRVRKLEEMGVNRAAAEICVVVPYGLPPPFKAKKPASI